MISDLDQESTHVSKMFTRFRKWCDVVGTGNLDSAFEKDKESEYCIVKYYEQINEDKMRSNCIDKALEWVRVELYKDPE